MSHPWRQLGRLCSTGNMAEGDLLQTLVEL